MTILIGWLIGFSNLCFTIMRFWDLFPVGSVLPWIGFALCFFCLLMFVRNLAQVFRARAFMRRGRLFEGKVLSKKIKIYPMTKALITYGYSDREGRSHQHTVSLTEKFIYKDIHAGDPAAILVDPQGRHGMLPLSLYNASFIPSERGLPEDHRAIVRSAQDISPPPDEAPQRALTLSPSFDRLDEGWWTLFAGFNHASLPAERLELDDNVLTLTQEGTVRATVDLSKPFTTTLSVWLVDAQIAEINVTLRQRGASKGAVSFRVRRPQDTIDANIPLKQGQASTLSNEDFAWLWPLLRSWALTHGERLDRITLDTETQSAPVEHVQQEEASAPAYHRA